MGAFSSPGQGAEGSALKTPRLMIKV